MTRSSGVYWIRNAQSGKIYVGSSASIEARWHEHRRLLRKGTHHSVFLQRAWDKHSEAAFVFEVLEISPRGMLFIREQFWIDELSACARSHGYNMLPNAGTVAGRVLSEITRAKMSV